MRTWLGFIIVFYCGSAVALEARVLIDEGALKKAVTGDFQLHCLKAPKKGCRGRTFKLPHGQWQLQRSGAALVVLNLKTQQKYRMRGQHFRFTGNFSVDGKPIQHLELVFQGKTTDWVAHFPVDQYLYGVMTAEVPVSWPLQSLKAQAVASRTYFLFKKMERLKLHYDVRSDIMDQVFKMDAKKHQSIMTAVNETHGMVLVSKEKGQIFPAYFHSDCGGHTSSENMVWRKPSSMNQAVQDPYCKTASKNNWSYGIDKQQLLGLLHKAFYLPAGVQLVSILPRIHKQSRAHIVDFLFSNNILKRIRANDFRRLLGFGRLKSTQFEVEDSWDKVVFSGRGFGHGVGMCQWGAQRWARKGKDYRTILQHYYPQARLKKLDSRSLQAQIGF